MFDTPAGRFVAGAIKGSRPRLFVIDKASSISPMTADRAGYSLWRKYGLSWDNTMFDRARFRSSADGMLGAKWFTREG